MATEDFKRKLTAIFSADVVGYSRLMGDNEAETVKTLETYKGVMFTLIKQHRGRVVDATGDNLLAEFGSVVDAVQCAVAVQKELQARNSDLPEKRKMRFRIGINLGDVIEEQDRLYGDGVNIAARLEALAEPGGICVSKTAFDHIESKLPLGYQFLGEQEVKNITKPVGAYKVLMETRVIDADEEAKTKVTPFWRRKAFISVGVVVILVIIAGIFWKYYLSRPSVEPASEEKMAFPLPETPSIAVLPFTNMSGDPNQEHIADGITESIITALSKMPHMFVIARNSTFTYKGKPITVQKVSEDLGVRYVLEGSVQKSDIRLRITAQLIDAIKGHHIWSERYDREMKDIFALQDEITLKIIKVLQVTLTTRESDVLRSKGTDNIEAYLKLLKGWDYYHRMSPADRIKARHIAEEVIALDPEYSRGYALLSTTHTRDVVQRTTKSRSDSLEKAFQLAQKAINKDSSEADGHVALGEVYMHKREFESAIEKFEKAIALDPNSYYAYWRLGGVLYWAGRPEEAIPVVKKAIRLNPFYSDSISMPLANAYYSMENYEKAILIFQKIVRNHPDRIGPHTGLVACYTALGRTEEAKAEAIEVLRINPKFSLERLSKVLPFRDQDVKARHFKLLRKAGLPEKPQQRFPKKPSIAVLPFTNMSGDSEQEYFCDGITEEIITALSKLPSLLVISRNSTFTYKGKAVKVQEVGKALNVRYVLEGSVRKADNRIRITAQLVDAMTGNHIWADRYDRDFKDIFALQDEITMQVLAELQVELTEGEHIRLASKGTDNLQAYLKYIQGDHYMDQQNPDDNAIARQLYEEALELDPDFATAYVLLAATYTLDIRYGKARSKKENDEKAYALLQKALELDDSNALAYTKLWPFFAMSGEWDKAIATANRGVALAPNDDICLEHLGIVLMSAGRPEESIPIYQKVLRLNPLHPRLALSLLGEAYRYMEKHEEAIQWLKKDLQIYPKRTLTLISLAACYAALDRMEEAQATVEKVLKMNSTLTVEKFIRRTLHSDPAALERYAALLRKAGMPSEGKLIETITKGPDK